MTLANRSMQCPAPRRQRGVVLMVALIVLVALTLAGLSMVRSSDTGVVIAGNLSFRQAAAHAMDAGVEAAIAALPADIPLSGTAIAGKYHPFIMADADGDGLPDLPAGQSWRGQGNPTDAYSIAAPGGMTGYTVRYVVERMCFTGPAITNDLDAQDRCNLEPKVAGFQSAKLGSADIGQFQKLHYRVTVKVEGPRNTETFAQAVLSR
jgi:type IV pilus assembly protein PilX